MEFSTSNFKAEHLLLYKDECPTDEYLYKLHDFKEGFQKFVDESDKFMITCVQSYNQKTTPPTMSFMMFYRIKDNVLNCEIQNPGQVVMNFEICEALKKSYRGDWSEITEDLKQLEKDMKEQGYHFSYTYMVQYENQGELCMDIYVAKEGQTKIDDIIL